MDEKRPIGKDEAWPIPGEVAFEFDNGIETGANVSGTATVYELEERDIEIEDEEGLFAPFVVVEVYGAYTITIDARGQIAVKSFESAANLNVHEGYGRVSYAKRKVVITTVD